MPSKIKIKKVEAVGGMVRIVSSNGDSETITRKEALLRAAAVSGSGDSEIEDIREELIKACQKAKTHSTGKPYASVFVDQLLKVKTPRAAANKLDKIGK
jgi:hypothetical protein